MDDGFDREDELEPREELSPEQKEKQKKAAEKAHADESNAKAVKVAGKAVATAYFGKAGGKAVDIVASTKTGQAVINTAGKAVTQANKYSLGGKQLQGVINTANDTGLINAADTVAGGVSKESLTKEGAKDLAKETGKQWAKDKVTGKGGSEAPQEIPQDEGVKTEQEEKEEKKKKRKGFLKKILVRSIIFSIFGFGAIFLILFVAILGPALGGLLDLTEDIYKPTPKDTVGTQGPGVLTEADIQRMMIYVGDSRIKEMSHIISADDLTFIYNDQGNYNWFMGSARAEINSKIADPNVKIRFVVINLGLNDLNNYASYYNAYNAMASSNSDVHFLFLGLGPIADGQTVVPGATNQKVQIFNNQLKSKIGDNFIDIYGMVNRAEVIDGVSYTDTTYRKIHAMVLAYIKEHFHTGVPYLLDSYPSGTAGTNLLTTPIRTALGDDAYESLHAAVMENVNASGKCTRAAVAAAGVTLAYGLYQAGYRLPYYWGGGHEGSIYMGVNPKHGSQVGASCSPSTCYNYYGFDCSGFVSWALGNAMGKDIGGYVTTGFMSIGTRISFQEAGPGDILVNEGHVILVVENKGGYLVTLESAGGQMGLVFGQYTPGSASSYQIMSLQGYIDRNC